MSGTNSPLLTALNRASANTASMPEEAPDMTGDYNTALTPEEEKAYQDWAAANGKGNDTYDYDLRGAYKSGAATSANGHLPDTYKKPNHPTFSDQSQYSTPAMPGGSWTETGDGKYNFVASPTNLKMNSAAALQDYFAKREAGNTVSFPTQ